MATSGLANIKRTWSGNARDLIDDGSSGVVPMKPHAKPKPMSLNDRLLQELKNNPNGEFLEINARVEAEHAAEETKRKAKEEEESSSHDSNVGEQESTMKKPAITTSGTSRPGIPHPEDQVQITSGPNGTTVEVTRPAGQPFSLKARSDGMLATKKRQLPSSFGGRPDAEASSSRPKWAMTSSELKTGSKDKLQFLVKGSGNASAGRKSLESDRRPGKIFLSKEQQVVYELAVTQGKSIFFTGSAGTGKSVVLREIIRGLKRAHIHKQDAVAVTASTGIAACNIGGVTLHSFAGVGLGNEPKEQLLNKVKKNRKAVSRWLRTQSLVIDEISMIDPDFLEKLEHIGRAVRKNTKPFGGIQIIMTGDFFQLPPVNKTGGQTRYAFDAKCWEDIAQEKINLRQVFRQKDPEFVNMLNEVRFGTLSASSIATFTSLTRTSISETTMNLQPTRLFPLRAEVERANAEQMRDISRPKRTFDALDGGTLPVEQRDRILANFMAPKILHLKPGCQVMLIKNTDESLVNGSVGAVMTFLSPKDWNMAQYSGIDWDSIDPLVQTEQEIDDMIDKRYRSIGGDHSYESTDGATVVESSREASPERKPRIEYLEAMEREAKKERSRSRSASPEKQLEPRKYPVVRFLVPNSKPRTILCQPEVWKNEQPDGEVVASRIQIPLILAWAMSIHKSQGQTLPLVKIDLGKVFETGQAYVALSRAVSKDGLQVLNFNPHKVKVDKRVTNWYKSLNTIH